MVVGAGFGFWRPGRFQFGKWSIAQCDETTECDLD